MKKKHQKILQKHTVKFIENLEPKPLMRYLYGKGIIDKIDKEEILSERTRHGMSETLLDKLSRKGPEAFQELIEGLEKKQPLLACILLREEKERLEEKISEIKRERKKKEKELEEQIQKLESQLQRAQNEKKQLEEQIQDLENRTSPRQERSPPTKEHVTVSYDRDFDEKGAIFYLGSEGGTKKWVNPARVSDSGVKVTCSDSSADAANILEYYDPKRCSDPSWWCVDLGEKYTLRLSHYTLRQIGCDDRSFPKKWELQGRLNVKDKWISLRKHRDVNWRKEPRTYISDKRLPCRTKTWPIDDEVKGLAFRYFKIGRIEGETYEPTYRLNLAGIELYGLLSITKQN